MKSRKWSVFLITLALFALCASPGYALDYSFDAPEDYLFGRPTSDDTIYEWENPNQDRSKNTSLIPPGFGTPTSYLPNSGEYLTPNLVPGALNGGLVNQVGSASYSTGGAAGSSIDGGADGGFLPSTSIMDASDIPDASMSTMSVQYSGGSSDGSTGSGSGFTEVTSELYDTSGSLGRLEIPSIGVNVKIYEGTGAASLKKGAGHFTDTSIWDGNVCLAGHNRGASNFFGKIHTLAAGDTITLTTTLGTRTYSVGSVEKVSETDSSGTQTTTDNCITLYTCVMDERPYRWCVKAYEV